MLHTIIAIIPLIWSFSIVSVVLDDLVSNHGRSSTGRSDLLQLNSANIEVFSNCVTTKPEIFPCTHVSPSILVPHIANYGASFEHESANEDPRVYI